MNGFDLLPLMGAGVRLWTPLALAATGGVLSERSGVINIALEAMMLAGAYGAVSGAASGGPAAGIALGLLAGVLIGLLHAGLTQALRVPHILSGIGLNLGVLGLTTYALRLHGPGGLSTTTLLSPVAAALLTAGVVLLAWFILTRTSLGLRLRACGENPDAARAAGVSVARIRYGAIAASGALAGLGGVALALTGLGLFTENMTAGRGYIALAAVIFGRWSPVGAAAAALLFGAGDALQLSLQTSGLSRYIAPDFLALVPYIVTLIALAGYRGRSGMPAALGQIEE